MRRVLLIFALVAAPIFALTLDEAIEMALANHAQIGVANAALGAANERQNAAITNFLPTIGASYSRSSREYSTSQATETTSYKASLNLFRGFGDYAELRAASNTKQARSYELAAARADVILATKQAFYNYLKAEDTIAAARETLRSAQKQAADAEAFFVQGLIGAYERHAIALEAMQSEQTALRAESDLQVARLALESQIAAPLESPVVKIVFGAKELPKREKLQTMMLQNRSEIKSLEATIEAQKHQKTRAVSEALPTIDASVARERYEYESGYSGLEEQTVTMVTLNWQLEGIIKPYFAREAALYDQRALESQMIDLKRNLSLQLATIDERFRLAQRAFVIAQSALTLAEENLRIVTNRFNERLASASELIDADAALWRAREQYTLYYYDKQQAFAELERVVEGDLTDN
ncbi:hypothetical protein AGMMS50229_00410 [Campylobacterota bacterium]|nr:hypothetical protein AGMMS50229_00410 [Campylobacterota bacterium]